MADDARTAELKQIENSLDALARETPNTYQELIKGGEDPEMVNRILDSVMKKIADLKAKLADLRAADLKALGGGNEGGSNPPSKAEGGSSKVSPGEGGDDRETKKQRV
jgi:hypothetical protein